MQKNMEIGEKTHPETSFFVNGINVEEIVGVFEELRRANEKGDKASQVDVLERIQKHLGNKHIFNELSSEGIHFVLDQIVPLLSSEDGNVCWEAQGTLQKLLLFMRKTHVTPEIKTLAITMSKAIIAKLEKMCDQENSRWYGIWCLWIQMLIKVLIPPKEFSSINCVLKVVEKAFKNKNIDIRTQSFICWKTFLEVLVEEDQLFGNKINLISMPLCYTTFFNNPLAEIKFNTWWYFLCHTKGKIQKENYVIFSSFLKFCFEPYTTIQNGLMITKTTYVSPGKKISALRVKVICALIHMLGPANEATKVSWKKCDLPQGIEGIIDENIFRAIETEVILSCQEATLMLRMFSDMQSPFSVCRNLWKNLMRLLPKEDTLKSLKLLCDVLNVFRMECEKDARVQYYLQIVLQEVTSFDYGKCFDAPEQKLLLLEIFQCLTNFLFNAPPEILWVEFLEVIAKFFFQICSKSKHENMYENILNIIVKVNVRQLMNPRAFYIFFAAFAKYIRAHQKFLEPKEKPKFRDTVCETLFTWAAGNYSQYPSKSDFLKDWGPIGDKMYKRAEDIPALYNDLTGDSMPAHPAMLQSESNSVVDATQSSTSTNDREAAKKSRILRELERLKTDTIEGQRGVLPSRSERRKAKSKDREIAKEPEKAEKNPSEVEKISSPTPKATESPSEISKVNGQLGNQLHDHMYSMQKTPPKKAKITSATIEVKDEAFEEFDKMYKRAEDIPALYNDLTGDSMPAHPAMLQSESNSVVDATQSSTSTNDREAAKKSRILRELERLKTDTVEGQRGVLPSRSERRKAKSKDREKSRGSSKDSRETSVERRGTSKDVREASKDSRKSLKVAKEPEKAEKNPSEVEKISSTTPKATESPSEISKVNGQVRGEKRTMRRSSVEDQEEAENDRDGELSFLGKISNTPPKLGNQLHDHMYSMQKTPPKKAKITSATIEVKDEAFEEFVSQMLRREMEGTSQDETGCEEQVNIDNGEDINERSLELNLREQSEKTPEKMCLEVPPSSQQSVKSFGREPTGTQNLFSDTPEESLRNAPQNDLSHADTQVQTPFDETANNSLSESLIVNKQTPIVIDDDLPEILIEDNKDNIVDSQQDTLIQSQQDTLIESQQNTVICPQQNNLNESQKEREKSSNPNSLLKAKYRVTQNTGELTPKHTPLPRGWIKGKDSSQVDHSTPVVSPKFTSRAAQMLSMTASSPSTSKQEDLSAKKPPLPTVQIPKDFFRFSAVAPPLDATPKLGILKRKRETNLNDSDMSSKKRRIHFHDPPVTRTKEYILEESEKAEKLKVNASPIPIATHRANLLMDSPPQAESGENDGNDSDWEDLDEDVPVNPIPMSVPPDSHPKVSATIVKPLRQYGPKKKEKHLKIATEPSGIDAGESSSSRIEENDKTPDRTEEREESKLFFYSDQEAFQYVYDNMKDKFLDAILEEANESPMQFIQQLLCLKKFKEKVHSLSSVETIELMMNGILQFLKN
uniref:Telomere-associated protein Rif1 N-terminal domain-containing protein n=1 Tax=Lutzomyia longipalpis TaxID=7200 RepID=A0A1B0CY85_LUTLO